MSETELLEQEIYEAFMLDYPIEELSDNYRKPTMEIENIIRREIVRNRQVFVDAHQRAVSKSAELERRLQEMSYELNR